MDVKTIHYFISVFEERSFTKAAERMHVVQSALSMQIRNLEDELNVTLFHRAQRGLEPTVAGHRFYELCVPIARSIAAAKQELVELAQGASVVGSLRIGLTSSMCQNVLGNVLTKYHALYPQVEIAVTEAYARDITDQVQTGHLDLGLGALPLDTNSLSCRLGFTDEYVLVSGRPINGPSMTPCDLSTMKDLTLVIPSDRHLLGTIMRGHIASGLIAPKSVVTVNGMVAALESVRRSDWGAICLMNSVVDKLDDAEAYIYPITNPQTNFDLYLVHDLRKPLTPAAKIFIEMFENRLKEVRTLWSELPLHGAATH